VTKPGASSKLSLIQPRSRAVQAREISCSRATIAASHLIDPIFVLPASRHQPAIVRCAPLYSSVLLRRLLVSTLPFDLMSVSYPPPQHSYQTELLRSLAQPLPSPPAAKARWTAAEMNAAAADGATEETSVDVLSPTVQLHKVLLAQKRAAEAEAAATVAVVSPPPSTPSSPQFLITPDAFPPLPGNSPVHAGSSKVHQCAVHAAPMHHHTHGHACTRAASSSNASAASASAQSSRCCLVQHHRASWWNTRCSCIFSALPDELLLFSVFSLLGAGELATLGAVCSRWRFLASDRMLWSRVDLSSHARTVDPFVLDNVMSRFGRHVQTLKLCNLKLLDAPSLRRLGEEHLQQNQGNLRELHFCSLKAVDFSVLQSLFANGAGANLRELSLFGCVNVDDACVRLIRQSCPRLEDLSLRGCLKITDEAFADGAEVEDGWSEPVAGSWQSPAASSPQVQELSLSLAQLDQLDVSRSNSVVSTSSSSSSAASDALEVGRFAYLTNLNLANCKLLTEVGLTAAFRASPELRKLNLHALNPSDALLDVLSIVCPHLEQLHLSSANPFMGNTRLTDAGVQMLTSRITGMQQLNLQGSSQLTDACIAGIVDHWAHSLEKLNLGGCFRLTDKAVRILCQVEEEVHSSPSVSPASTPAPSLPSKLTHLSLFQCQNLTDASVFLIASRLPSLKHLDMHSCAALTDRSLDAIVQREDVVTTHSLFMQPLPTHRASASLDDDFSLEAPPSPSTPAPFLMAQLQSLDIGSCRKITVERVEQLKRARADLLVTHY
jgi:hypothetical protein